MANNKKRQEDEIAAISSIYEEILLFCDMDRQIKCGFTITLTVPQKLEIKVGNHNSPNETSAAVDNKIFVEHLPPIKFYVQLPDTYPSQKPPNFNLCILWLPFWEVSFLCQKLDEIWKENENNEILFLWLGFLQNDLFNFLGIHDSLDVSLIHMAHTTPQDYIESHLTYLCDSRAVNSSLVLDPIEYLVSYDKAPYIVKFNQKIYTCTICLEEYVGQKCIELTNCGHTYCQNCIKEHINVKIKENIYAIMCPTIDCNCQIDVNDIKTLCPDLVSQYEELSLQVALDTMRDIIYCPRISCHYPVIRNINDVQAMCPICYYCFCIYCRKVYHGVEPCEMISKNFEQLIYNYENSGRKGKKELERKYGKQQIQYIEKYLTTQYLKINAKSCPSCHTFISKSDGCNKMTCSHCQSYFCWLCNKKITSINAYEHFNGNSPCSGRLFEGMDFDYDIEQDII